MPCIFFWLYSPSKWIPASFFCRKKFCLLFVSFFFFLEIYFVIHRSTRNSLSKGRTSIRLHFCKSFDVNPPWFHWNFPCPRIEEIFDSGLEKFSHWRRFSADLHLSVEFAKFLLGNLALNPRRNPFNLLHGMTYGFPRFISCSFSQLKSRFSSFSWLSHVTWWEFVPSNYFIIHVLFPG